MRRSFTVTISVTFSVICRIQVPGIVVDIVPIIIVESSSEDLSEIYANWGMVKSFKAFI